MSESPPPPPSLLAAAIDMANILASLRHPDLGGLWRLGGQPLEQAYARLKEAIEEEHRQALSRQTARAPSLRKQTERDLFDARKEIRRLTSELERMADLLTLAEEANAQLREAKEHEEPPF